jgi:hypothetical protein
MDPEVGAVDAQSFRLDRQVDRLQEDIRGGARLGRRRRRPVAEGEESDFFHDDGWPGRCGDRFRRTEYRCLDVPVWQTCRISCRMSMEKPEVTLI